MIMGKWPLYAFDYDSLSQTSLKARFPPSWLNNENPIGDFTSFSLTSQNLTCRVPPVPVICHCVTGHSKLHGLNQQFLHKSELTGLSWWFLWPWLESLTQLYLAGSELAGSQSPYSHLVPQLALHMVALGLLTAWGGGGGGGRSQDSQISQMAAGFPKGGH